MASRFTGVSQNRASQKGMVLRAGLGFDKMVSLGDVPSILYDGCALETTVVALLLLLDCCAAS